MRTHLLRLLLILLLALGFLPKQAKATLLFINLEIQETSKNTVSINVPGNSDSIIEEYGKSTYEEIAFSQFMQLAAFICKRDALLTKTVITGKIKYKNKTQKLAENCKIARSSMFSESASTVYTRLVDKVYFPIQSYEVPISKGEVGAALDKELNLYGCNRFREIRNNLQALELCNSIYRKFK
ncbi:hypothetical protein H6G64_35435 [Calothrix sp. FACHB-156]|nr:hypothetical protein [Calothrix sp. FACHB-156]